ncbi:MAG: tyrosine-type recombinase/integrase [Phormidesmis sp.]
MAKPDPIPQFVEIKPPSAPVANPAERSGDKLDWVEQFLSDHEIRPNTKRAYLRHLRQFQAWLDCKHWADVTESDIVRYKLHLKNKPGKTVDSKGLSPASVNQALATLQSFFKWLATKRYIERNPTLTIERIKADPMEVKDIDVSLVHRLAEGLEYRGDLCVRDTAIFELLKHGLRAEEVSKLNVGDYGDRTVSIADAKWGSDGTVPLAPEACQAIESYLGWCVQQGLDTSAAAPLFKSLSNRSYGKRMAYRGIYNLIRDLSEIAGLEEPIHPHQLRHTFGTQMLLEGVDPEFVRNLMRIKSPQVFERYTKRALDEKSRDKFRETIKQSTSGLFSQS